MRGCGPLFAKYLLFFFNIIFFFGGGIILGVGIWLRADKNASADLIRVIDTLNQDKDPGMNINDLNTTTFIEQLSLVLIIAGGLIFIIGFLGCCGACNESQCCLILYAIFLMVILGLEVAAGIYAAVSRDKFEDKTRELMRKSIHTQYLGNNTKPNAVTEAWNSFMYSAGCCGVEGFRDFAGSPWDIDNQQNGGRLEVPVFCCRFINNQPIPGCPARGTTNTLNSNLNIGCYNKLTDIISNKANIAFWAAISIAAIQLLGIIFAFCLCCALEPR